VSGTHPMRDLLEDLAAEQEELDGVVATLQIGDWERPTPAAGWTIRDQIAHLAFFDEAGALAATDGEAFSAEVARASADLDAYLASHLEQARRRTPAALLDRWRAARRHLLAALRAVPPGARLPWYGPDMSPASFATARLMETWAHGQDVVDALGIVRVPTARLRHVAHLGVATFAWSFRVRGLPVPEHRPRVVLAAPDGGEWSWEGDAGEVRGSAEGFCLVVTQRRHPADTDLVAAGDVACRWLEVAQAFAGPPGPGRHPRG